MIRKSNEKSDPTKSDEKRLRLKVNNELHVKHSMLSNFASLHSKHMNEHLNDFENVIQLFGGTIDDV